MTIPGFTAEVSLGKGNKVYALAQVLSGGDSSVEPQFALRCHSGYGCDIIYPNPGGDPIVVHVPEETNT
jgi:hypothetical protein